MHYIWKIRARKTELALCASGKGEEGSLGEGGWGDVAKTNIRTTEQTSFLEGEGWGGGRGDREEGREEREEGKGGTM